MPLYPSRPVLDTPYVRRAKLTPAHPPLLVLPTITAHAAVRVRSVGAVIQVVAADGGQCGRPPLIGVSESPNLLRG
jgi:hypothetical protein